MKLLRNFALVGVTFSLFGFALQTHASNLDAIFNVAQTINAEGRKSQARIDELTEDARELVADYKVVMKEVEGLRVYNGQLERQIANQNTEMAQLNESIDQVTVIERQITPLMLRMIDGLEQFVSLDVPFLMEERTARIERLRDMMERADVVISEKFSQVLNAYQIESEFGRTMEAYAGEVNGRSVDMLRVGRISLVYQTEDGSETGAWDQANKQWVQLGDNYTTSVRNGIRMARKQMAVNLFNVPIPGAE